MMLLVRRINYGINNKSIRLLSSYKAVNEDVISYDPGTDQRKALDKKIQELNSSVQEVPVVVGDEEIKTKHVRYQLKPYDHKSQLAKFYDADAAAIQKAIEVSQKAHRAWESTPLEKRCEVMLKAADLISTKYRMDMLAATMIGQAKTSIQAEIDATCELADFYRFNVQWALEASQWQPISGDTFSNRMILRGLEGFWAAVAPFNFTAISGHLVGAPVLMGNVVLWKPASTAILSSYVAFKLLREAGVPPGVINFVPSSGAVFGDNITKSHLLAGINFTGSTGTFEHLWLQVAKNLKHYKNYPRLVGECGGKNFHLVHESADILNVVNCTIRSAFEYGGQKCSACSRMYVPDTKWNEISDGLINAQKKVKIGSPLEDDTFFSAVIDDKSFKSIRGYIEKAKSSSDMKIVAGGKCDDSKGYFIEPTIVQTTNPQCSLMNEEIFGPVLTIYVYKANEFQKVLQLVDSTSEFGLTGAVFAQDKGVIEDAKSQLRFSAGNLYINDKSTGAVVSQQPFGGARKSGTNDKAGGPNYILRFANPLIIKTQQEVLQDWGYKDKSKRMDW